MKHADTLVRDAAAYLLCRGSNLGTLGPHRAEFEFGNFYERIERRIGQEVRRGFRVAERHEHHIFWYVAIRAHLDLDCAAARLAPDKIPRFRVAPRFAFHIAGCAHNGSARNETETILGWHHGPARGMSPKGKAQPHVFPIK